MTIEISKIYQKVPEGTIPEALISTLSLSLSDSSILTPYNVSELTEALTQQLSLKAPSKIQADDEYIYFAFTILLELVMKGRATFHQSQTGYTAIEWLLANPSFKDWMCSQKVFQETKHNIYQFLIRLSGKKGVKHVQTHLQNGLRETLVEPFLYYLYEDKKHLLEEISRATYSQIASKKKEFFQVAGQVRKTAEKISEGSTDEAIDLGIELAQSLVNKTKKYTRVPSNKIGVFFHLLTSPKPKELMNILSIHGLVETPLVSLIYARPNVEDLTVRALAVATGAYTESTVLCAVVAHSYLAAKRKEFVPSQTDKMLIRLFKTVQRETRGVIEHAHSVLSEGMKEKKISPLAQKYVLNFPQFLSAFVFAELFYSGASQMKTAMYTPYILEHFGHLLSEQWKLCEQNPFSFRNKLDAIALQVAVGTLAQITLKNSHTQMISAILTTPFVLDQMQQSRLYRSFVKKVWPSSEEIQPMMKHLKRTWKIFSLTIDLVKGVSPAIITWGSRAVTSVAVGSIGGGAYVGRHRLEKLKKGAVSVAGKGMDLYGGYYRIQLAAQVAGATMAPMIELIVDPSNLNKLTGVCAASMVQHTFDSPFAAIMTAQSIEMVCERLQIFEYKKLQDRANRGWSQARAHGLTYAKSLTNRLLEAGNWMYQNFSK